LRISLASEDGISFTIGVKKLKPDVVSMVEFTTKIIGCNTQTGEMPKDNNHG